MDDPLVDDLIEAARRWFDAGFSVIPTHPNGTKRPFGAWKEYQTERMTWEELERLILTGTVTGIGVITGSVSGDLELIEIEGPAEQAKAALQRIREIADTMGCGALLERIIPGCATVSAGGGLHLFIRISDGPALANTKLATRADGTVLAETRGQGGFAIVAPTTGRAGHPDGSAYRLLTGASPANTPEVTSAERDLLHHVFTVALHEPSEQNSQSPHNSTSRNPCETLAATSQLAHSLDPLTPWGEFATRTTWEEILTPAGWQRLFTDSEQRTYWTRPGKNPADGISATTRDPGPLYVFTTSTVFPANEGLSKQAAYAYLHHGGDYSAAARALANAGYGQPHVTPPLTPWNPPPATPEANPGETDYDRAVQRKYAELRVTEDARALLATHKTGQAPPLDAIRLDEFLAQPDEDIHYRIDGLWPANGRVLLSAAAKSGKTTLIAVNLIPALVNGDLFLGRAPTQPVTGRVVLFNMEVGPATMRRWLRDAPIHDPSKVIVVNLRGKAAALQLHSDAGRNKLATWLTRQRAEVAILDPLAPLLAALGLDENSNADVALFFSWWGQALTAGGVQDDFIAHHTGHAGERSRGASRLLDEPDAIWNLSKDKDEDEEAGDFTPISPARNLSAYGRDVDLAPEGLAFDQITRQLTLTGTSPKQARKAKTRGDQERKILSYISTRGHATTTEIQDHAGVGRGDGKTRGYKAILDDLVARGLLDYMADKRSRLYFIPSSPPSPPTSPKPPGDKEWMVPRSPLPRGDHPGNTGNTENNPQHEQINDDDPPTHWGTSP